MTEPPVQDAAAQAVALEDEIIAELQQTLGSAQSEQPSDSTPPPSEEVEGGSVTLEQAKTIAKEATEGMDAIVEEHRAAIGNASQRNETDRHALADKRIAAIKEQLNAQP